MARKLYALSTVQDADNRAYHDQVNLSEGPEQRRPQLLLCAAWVLIATAATLFAGALLGASIADSSHYVSENRAPGLEIAIAALVTAVALSGVGIAVARLRGRRRKPSMPTGLLLSATYVLLVSLFAIVSLASGRT